MAYLIDRIKAMNGESHDARHFGTIVGKQKETRPTYLATALVYSDESRSFGTSQSPGFMAFLFFIHSAQYAASRYCAIWP
jgi:hypothetical protein